MTSASRFLRILTPRRSRRGHKKSQETENIFVIFVPFVAGFRSPLRGRRPLESRRPRSGDLDRKSTRLNSSHVRISYAVFCLKKKKQEHDHSLTPLKHLWLSTSLA